MKKRKNEIIEECILALQNGNTDSLKLLYETIKGDVYAFALSKVTNKYDADDILQDTFVRIYENANLYVPKGKPMSWIMTIEMNVINRFYNLRNRNENVNEEVVINTSSPIDIEEKIINSELVKELLDKLNETEREVISLHLVSGLKFREIADLLNKPLSTVLSKYNRAIKKLKEIVKEDKNNEKDN